MPCLAGHSLRLRRGRPHLATASSPTPNVKASPPLHSTPAQATYVYWRGGGLYLGVFAVFVLLTTQTCRLYSDFWVG